MGCAALMLEYSFTPHHRQRVEICVETPPAGRKAGPTKVRYDWLA
jgi:hypothetical protein